MTKPATAKRHVANSMQIYRRLFIYVRRYWVTLTAATVASMLYSGVDAWLIRFLEPLLNKGFAGKDHHFLHGVPFLIMGVFILRGIASFFSAYCIASTSRNVIMLLRRDLFGHLQRLPAKFYDHNTTGQILSVLLYGVDQVANASADVATAAIQALFLIAGLLIVMFSISWKLTLMYFIIVPLVAVLMRMTSLRVRRISLGIQDSISDLSHCAEENIEGYKVVRAFEGQAYELDKFNKATYVNRQREMKVVVTRSLSTTTVQLLTAFMLALLVYVATLDIANSLLTPGAFAAMGVAMLTILKPMKDLASVQNKLDRGLAGAQIVFELLDQKPEQDTGEKTLQRARGRIAFKNVNFTYDEHKPVLSDISLTIEPGQVIALVGRSGSGKSTLVSLLPRFYDNFQGEISIDGHSVRDYHLADLRRQFALVSQQVTLFHDTIYNNIAYGRFNQVTEAQVIAAAKAAHAMEFIERLPQGLNTLVGENGVLLSGGQRQRLAIARAILKDAPILILDEATSALDTESERSIQAALEALMRNRTTLVIAHRLSTIEHADKIVVMEDGRITEMGTHAELLTSSGQYAKLHNMQFREMPLEVVNGN